MNTNNVSTAGVADCARGSRVQPTAPGSSPQSPQSPASLPRPPVAPAREVTEGDCFSFDAELKVLGCILLEPKVALKMLSEEAIGLTHFYDLRNRALFELLQAMAERHEEINLATVWHRATQAKLKWTEHGPSFMADLPEQVPSVFSLNTFIEELKEMRDRRLALDVSRRLAKVAGDLTAPVGQLLEDAENAFRQLCRITNSAPYTMVTLRGLSSEVITEGDNLLGDRLLARGQSLTLLGAGGIGKSRLLLQMACCSVVGRPFLGLPVHQPGLKWLIFQAENSKRRLQHDVQHLARWLGSAWEQVCEKVVIHLVDRPEDAFVQLDLPGVARRMSAAIERFDPDVICFDPLNCFAAGDLNRDEDMRAICQALTRLSTEDRTDRALVVLHHALTGKAGAARATGFDRASFGRNSKLLQAWTRGQINLAPFRGGDNRQLVVSCGKCSNGVEFEPFKIRLNPETMIYEAQEGFDHDAWQRQLAGENARLPEDDLLDLCAQPLARAEAVRQLIAQGSSQATAYRLVQRVVSEGLLRLEQGTLHRVEPADSGATAG